MAGLAPYERNVAAVDCSIHDHVLPEVRIRDSDAGLRLRLAHVARVDRAVRRGVAGQSGRGRRDHAAGAADRVLHGGEAAGNGGVWSLAGSGQDRAAGERTDVLDRRRHTTVGAISLLWLPGPAALIAFMW